MTSTSYRPRDGEVVGAVADTTAEQLAEVLARAASAAPAVAAASPRERLGWLDAVATALETNAEELAEYADAETALGMPRLRGEVMRTASQLRFYGEVAREGSWLGVTIDNATATSGRLVRCAQPVGPVAVFGASNFPFAFGTLGNDTGSAIAAGCPVVVKAHPAHIVLSLRLAELAEAALAAAGAPAGTFQVVTGMQSGIDLVKAAPIKAVGFTGSQAGGTALWKIANERDEVIPVYAEMGTVNSVVMTPAAASRMSQIAEGFVASFTLGSGQFCTKPGLMLAPAGSNAAQAVADALTDAQPVATALTQAIAGSAASGIEALVAAGAQIVGTSPGTGHGWSMDATVLAAPIEALVAGSALLEECFGPVAVVVEYRDEHDRDRAILALQASLAASVFTSGDDDPDAARIIAHVAGQVGRVTRDEWPTGVAWSWAQQHGGPWPATSAPWSTSVGAAALDRFVRPVTFQAVPDAWLPAAVRQAAASDNPWQIPQRIDGKLRVP